MFRSSRQHALEKQERHRHQRLHVWCVFALGPYSCQTVVDFGDSSCAEVIRN